MSEQTIPFEQVIARGCGIDVHKKIIVATIRGLDIVEETREFDSFTSSIENLKTWLLTNKITHVAMESTGVYWKPIFNIFENDFEIVLVNARHIKNVPGHKTDKKDSKWITKLLLSGLLKASFIPPKPIRQLRDLTRYRRKVVSQIASEKNRIQKILEDANIKLSSVISSMSGVAATKIISDIINGNDDVEHLINYHSKKMKATKEELASSLNGHLTDHHRYMLNIVKKSMESKQQIISDLDARINKQMEEFGLDSDVTLLQTIPGVGKDSASGIIAEIGVNMSQFPDEHHLASWAGMSPGTNESAGKKKVLGQRMGIIT